jgi:cell division septal protein FtsQ
MSGSTRSRRRWRRTVIRLAGVVVLLGLTATIAAGLQVHELRVTGTKRFPKTDIEAILRHALGAPTIATRAESLRTRVCSVPWVADARVHMSLDGVVTCEVEERVPRAVAVDGVERMLMDSEGRLLAAAPGVVAILELHGFAAFPGERAAVLAAAAALEQAWGAALSSIVRTGPRDVELHFASTSVVVLADPARPDKLATARRVLAAWIEATGALPERLDARAQDRVAVLPPPPEELI